MDNQVLLWMKNKDFNYVVMIGVTEGGLYNVSKKFIKSLIHDTANPCELWYRRLGHLHFKALPRLHNMVKVCLYFLEHDSACTSCSWEEN